MLYLGEFGVVFRAYLCGWKGKSEDLVAVKTMKGLYTNLFVTRHSYRRHITKYAYYCLLKLNHDILLAGPKYVL